MRSGDAEVYRIHRLASGTAEALLGYYQYLSVSVIYLYPFINIYYSYMFPNAYQYLCIPINIYSSIMY